MAPSHTTAFSEQCQLYRTQRGEERSVRYVRKDEENIAEEKCQERAATIKIDKVGWRGSDGETHVWAKI